MGGQTQPQPAPDPQPLESRLYYLAWCDRDGARGSEEEYQTLAEVTARGEEYQRAVEARGNVLGRRYEVRERVYGRVVVRMGRRGRP